jgi:hypothetical protein
MAIQENFNDLVVATYGRGFWILDDITPLRELTDAVFQSSVHSSGRGWPQTHACRRAASDS